MLKIFFILFCESQIQPNKVDKDFEDQFLAAKQNGFEILLFNLEDLISNDKFQLATKRIKANDTLVHLIYRGWMLTPKKYEILYHDLISKNYKLINNPVEYQNCHYLPDSLKYIEDSTPKTIYEKLENENSIDSILQKSKKFGEKEVIVKDYVKSEKHDWETACFVPNASDTNKLKNTINNLLQLRGEFLNEGIVVREFIELNQLTTHSKSGMPLTEEYRLFFFQQQLIGMYDYWEEGKYNLKKPDTSQFEKIAKNIESNFFSMDIARKKNGDLIIIELGDGQVAGLPEKSDKNEFYNKLKSIFSK